MMLELSQHVQSFLYANNKPPPLSFYEQMMSNKQRQEEQEALEQQRKMDLLRRKEEKEVRRLVLTWLVFVVCLSQCLSSLQSNLATEDF